MILLLFIKFVFIDSTANFLRILFNDCLKVDSTNCFINQLIDQVEEDLLTEKMKIKKVSDDLNQTFEDMINMSVWNIVDYHIYFGCSW